MEATRQYNAPFVWMICSVSAMGGLLFGYDWVVLGGARVFYEPHFGIETESSAWLSGFTASSALLGCLVGAACSGLMTDRTGRKIPLLVSGVLFTASAIWTALATDLIAFNLARVLGGIGIGLASNLSPMYIAEVSPASKRGQFVSINQLTIVIGVLAAQLVNGLIANGVGEQLDPRVDQVLQSGVDGLIASGADEGVGQRLEELISIDTETQVASGIKEEIASSISKSSPPDEALLAMGVDGLKALKVYDEVSGAIIRDLWYGKYGWRWMFAAETVPALAFFLLMFFIPESPRWLAGAGLWDRAKGVLARIGNESYAAAEAEAIERQLASTAHMPRQSFTSLFGPSMRPLLLIGVGLAVFQQWCGINAIFYYAPEIFEAAGLDIRETFRSIAYTGVVNLVATLIALPLVDRFGRRPLMLFGAGSLTIIYTVLAFLYVTGSQGFHMVVLVLAAIACYAVSLAPVTWVLISEIFPARVRGAAVSIAVLALWSACAILAQLFPPLNDAIGTGPLFGLFAAFCGVGFALLAWRLPETRGRSLEELERELASPATAP